MDLNEDLQKRLAAFERWQEKDYLELRARMERHNRVLFGDESDRRASGLVEDVRKAERGQQRSGQLVTVLIVINVFQLLFILVLFFLVFRLLAI
jgi:hypothetical protein